MFSPPSRHCLWLSLLLLAGAAAADECERLPRPSVTLQRLDEAVTLNTEYGYLTLTNLGASKTRPGQKVLGLTRGQATARYTTSLTTLANQTRGWECASPRITLTYGFSPLTVYVAREFPRGSCAFNEIYEHEMRHVAAYRAHAAAIEKEIADTLTRRFATDGPWRGQIGETAGRLKREMEERWLPYIQRELNRAQEAQARIDSVEEYQRVAKACNGEVGKGLR